MDESYDGAPIYQAVRKRHHALQERVQKLMQAEIRLEGSIAKGAEKARNLKDAIGRVLKIPADASEMQRMSGEVEVELKQDRDALASLQRELALVREAMKFADMAHEALHWGGFADQTLERFDREKTSMSGRLQEAV